jgi:hypothetical protein
MRVQAETPGPPAGDSGEMLDSHQTFSEDGWVGKERQSEKYNFSARARFQP